MCDNVLYLVVTAGCSCYRSWANATNTSAIITVGACESAQKMVSVWGETEHVQMTRGTERPQKS